MRWTLFAGLPEDEVREVLAIARRRRFARGEVVFHQDDLADSLHLVAKGRFAVRMPAPLGEMVVLTVLVPGEAFGELSLVGDEQARRSARVDALEPAETLCVHRIDIDRLRERRPEVDKLITAMLAAQVRRLSARLVEALHVPADKRVRRRLLEMAQVYGDDGEVTGAVVPLTQDDLAELTGASRGTVNRVLREEVKRGTIELARGRTTVVDPEQLARRSR